MARPCGSRRTGSSSWSSPIVWPSIFRRSMYSRTSSSMIASARRAESHLDLVILVAIGQVVLLDHQRGDRNVRRGRVLLGRVHVLVGRVAHPSSFRRGPTYGPGDQPGRVDASAA